MPIFLTESVAQRIVDRAMAIINRNVNVMDRTGIIIGSGDSQRLHHVHEGALRVLEYGHACEIGNSHIKTLKGVQPGINLPIRFRGEIVGVVGVTGAPEEVSQFADLVVMTAELMIENAAMMSEIHWNQRQTENIIFEMIHGEAEVDELFEVRTRKLGIDPHLPRVAIVISMKTADGKDLSVDEVDKVQRVLRQGHPNDLIALVCPTQAVMLHTVNHCRKWHPDMVSDFLQDCIHRMDDLGDIDFRIALGRFIPGLNNIPLSYRSAQEALQIGMKLHPEKRFYRYFDFQMDSVLLELTDNWKGRELQLMIAPLVKNDKNGVLRKTLRTFIELHTDASAASRQLHIHRNTLGYRLDRIEQLTGRNPKHFNDLVFLHFSLRLHELMNTPEIYGLNEQKNYSGSIYS